METLRIFDCSKTGDWRFYPSNCLVSVSGYLDSIERHVALSKRINKDGKICAPISIEEANAYPVVAFVCGGILLPPQYLTQFISLLWHKYLTFNPDLVRVLMDYEEYDDQNQYQDVSHASMLRQYMQPSDTDAFGLLPPTYGKKFRETFEPLMELLRGTRTLIEEGEVSLFNAPSDVLTLLVPHKGEVGAEVWQKLQAKHKSFVRPIKRYLQDVTPESVGECRLFESQQQRLAVIYYDRFDKAQMSFSEGLHTLKTLAKENGWAVSLPFDLGETTYTQTWNDRYALTEEIFSDYYVTLHHVM